MFAALALSGCDEEKNKTVEYYMQNSDERKAKIAECKNNPGELALQHNCVNASKAETKASMRKEDTRDYSGAFGN